MNSEEVQLSRDNRDIYTSYLFTMAKYDFSIYEKRIVYRLIDLAQAELEGLLLKDNLRSIHKRERARTITMPIAYILKDEKDENYTIAKQAFRSLSCKGLEYEDENFWAFINIIAAPRFDKKVGCATFDVYDEIWQCLLNFTKGYRKYELNTIMSFNSVYTMRMYELISGQKTPLTFINGTFESLCDRFKLPKTMRRPQIFEEKVLNKAKKELDARAPYSFVYRRETIPWRGRIGQKIIGYTFYPVEIPANRDPKLEEARLAAKVGNIAGPNGMLNHTVVTMLEHLGFTREEINRNKTLFINSQRTFTPDGLIDLLGSIRNNAFRGKKLRPEVQNLKGYIINGLKNAMKESAPLQLSIDSPNGKISHEEAVVMTEIANITAGLADKFNAK